MVEWICSEEEVEEEEETTKLHSHSCGIYSFLILRMVFLM